LERVRADACSDEGVARRVLAGDTPTLYEIIIPQLQPAALPGGRVSTCVRMEKPGMCTRHWPGFVYETGSSDGTKHPTAGK
jgi:hypothetical protein